MIFRVVKNILYLVICVASVFSNSMLITVLVRFEHLRTTSSIFILNLAVCDMTTVLLAIPFTIAIEESASYPFGQIGCKVLMPAATAAWNSAAFTLLAIAIERFYAIIFPMRARLHSCKTKCVILCILHGIAIASVIPFSIHHRYFKKSGKEHCLEIWPDSGERVYTLFLFSIQYVIPLSLIVVLYSKAWNAIRRQNKTIIEMQEMQQKGACHYSRSQSLDNGRFTSISQIDSSGIDYPVKTSFSNYSIRSTQLEIVDEKEQDDGKGDLVKAMINTLGSSTSSNPLKSSTFVSNADGYLEDDIHDMADASQGKKNHNCRDHDDVDVSAERDIENFKTTGAKCEEKTKLQRISESMPFWGKKNSQFSILPCNAVEVPINENKMNSKILETDTENTDPEMVCKETKFSIDVGQQEKPSKQKEPTGRRIGHCIDYVYSNNRRKRIKQSTSTSVLLSCTHDNISGNENFDAAFEERSNMKQSTSSPVLQSSSAHFQPNHAKEAASRLMGIIHKTSLSNHETKLSKLSQMASNARRRLSIALGSGNHDTMSVASIKRMKQTRRTLKMFSCVVAVFAVCMLPNQITWIWVAFNGVHLNRIVTTIFYFLTYTNSVINPWIYGAVNPTFRKAYKALFMCKGKKTMRMRNDQQTSGKVSSLRLSHKLSDHK